MNLLAARLGFWASLICLICFAIYGFSFTTIAIINPIFTWTDFSAFVKYSSNYNQLFKHLAMWFMLIYGICYLIQVVCLGECFGKSKKIFSELAALFGTGFALLIGINYFIQLTTVRLQLETGQTQELVQFIMSFPISAIAAINMLGWTVFFGLSTIFAGLCLGDTKIERTSRRALFANGIVMLTACVGYAANSVAVVFLCMYIGLGATVLIFTTSQCFLFKRKYHELKNRPL